MNIVFRVDASTIIGYGHVMRCLTLANALANRDADVSFISREHNGHINHLITEKKYPLILLAEGERDVILQNSDTWLGCTPEQDAEQCILAMQKIALTTPIDYLIVDHYAINSQWHKQVAPYCKKLMVIDDLASRAMLCDLLLDQTLNRSAEQYQALVPKHCTMLLGKDYMLLRDEFSHYRTQAKIRREMRSRQLGHDKSDVHIMISMGGGDPNNLTKVAFLALKKLQINMPNIHATVVISSQSQHVKSLQTLCDSFAWCTLITNCNDMAKIMLKADIAIGASGSTAWERCCLGLPCLTTVNAENQQLIAKNLSDEGASINLGWHQDIKPFMICEQLEQIIMQPKIYQLMVENCFNVCDGQGAKRVARTLLNNDLSRSA